MLEDSTVWCFRSWELGCRGTLKVVKVDSYMLVCVARTSSYS